MANIKKEDAKNKISELVKEFKINENYYTNTNFKEMNVRSKFIDKFFEALGWGVNGTVGINPEEEDVIQEDSIEDEGKIKFVDYTFRANKKKQFFVEAKKPSESISKKSYIFQAKSYSFSQQIPYIILTNFKEFALYDITVKPLKNQPDTDLVIEYKMTYEDYIDKFDLLWDTFSRDAVYNKSLAKLYVKRRKINSNQLDNIFNFNYEQTKGASLLNDAFLYDLRRWREKLANQIYKMNRTLNIQEINEITQRTLDRILFLRILEDREIELNEHLRELVMLYESKKLKQSLKESLDELYNELNNRYNGLLFHKHELSDKIHIEDEFLVELIKSFYIPESPYNFAHIKIDILGKAFEQFLGEEIVLNSHGNIHIEFKNYIKKSNGIYYTPQYIVERIVKKTLTDLFKNKTIEEISKLTIVDIACGSGSFLIEAYRFILNYYSNYYNSLTKKNPIIIQAQNDKLIYEENGIYKLTLDMKSKIVKNNIFGVDIDYKAVEVAKMSLYIIMLEDGIRRNDTYPILPNLEDNLKEGNSILGTDYYERDDIEEQNVVITSDFDMLFSDIMKSGGFDCILGNPPYIRIQILEEIYSKSVVNYIKERYKSASGNFDISIVFLEKSLGILKDNGLIGVITSNTFFDSDYGINIRNIISEGGYIQEIVDFTDQDVFNSATNYTCLLFLTKKNMNEFKYLRVNNLNTWILDESSYAYEKYNRDILIDSPWKFINEELENHFEINAIKLGQVTSNVFVGLQLNGNDIYILKEEKSDDKYIYAKSNAGGDTIYKFERESLKPFIKGSQEIHRYELKYENKWIIFPYDIVDNKGVEIKEEDYKVRFENTWKYLLQFKNILENRKLNKIAIKNNIKFDGFWYGYIYKKNLSRIGQKKILFSSLTSNKKVHFSLDEQGIFYMDGSGQGGGGGYAIVLPESSPYSWYSFLGVLNSKVIDYERTAKGKDMKGKYKGLSASIVKSFYVPKIDFKNDSDIQTINNIEKRVKVLINLYEQKRKCTTGNIGNIESQINAHEQAINKYVYELYRLNEENIKFIEKYLKARIMK